MNDGTTRREQKWQREDRRCELLETMIDDRERGYMRIDQTRRGYWLTETDHVEEWSFELGRSFLGRTHKAAYRALRRIYCRRPGCHWMANSPLNVELAAWKVSDFA
jgi:hypothetical protein